MVVYAVRTRLPFQSSRPSRVMLGMTIAVAALALALPYTPLAAPFGFSPLPIHYLLIIFAIIALYFISAEAAKRWFYRRFAVQAG